MKKKPFPLGIAFVILLMFIVACREETPGDEDEALIPNPAAVFCEDQGYSYEILGAADGSQHGVCIFPDGGQCDDWDYFNGHCGPDSPRRQVAGIINLVAVADLRQTTQIDVLRREEGNDSTPVYFEELFVIADTETIHTIVESLDRDLNLSLRARCQALYTLVFHLNDGSQSEFGYACEMASPSFLRGGQVFWQGQDVLAPDTFNRVFSVKLSEVGSM